MFLVEVLDTFGCSDEASEEDIFDAMRFESFGGHDSGAAGSEHGVDEDDLSFGDIVGEFFVVGFRFVCCWVSFHTEVTECGFGED